MRGITRQAWYDSVPVSVNWINQINVPATSFGIGFVSNPVNNQITYIQPATTYTTQISTLSNVGRLIKGVSIAGNSSVYSNPYSLTQDSVGNTYIAGTHRLGSDQRGQLSALSTNNSVIWQNDYYVVPQTGNVLTSFEGSSIVLGPSGNLYAGGYASDGINSGGIFIKVNSVNGSFYYSSWSAGTDSFSFLNLTGTDSSENLYANYAPAFGALTGYYKFNSDGVRQWGKKANITQYGSSWSSNSGNTIIGGVNAISFTQGCMLLAKLDTNGNLLWSKAYWSSNYDRILPNSVYFNSDNTIWINGDAYVNASQGTSFDTFVLQLDQTGSILSNIVISSTVSGNIVNDFGEWLTISNVNVVLGDDIAGIPTVISIPTNGSKTGTYTIGNTAITIANVAFTSNANVISLSSATSFVGEPVSNLDSEIYSTSNVIFTASNTNISTTHI